MNSAKSDHIRPPLLQINFLRSVHRITHTANSISDPHASISFCLYNLSRFGTSFCSFETHTPIGSHELSAMRPARSVHGPCLLRLFRIPRQSPGSMSESPGSYDTVNLQCACVKMDAIIPYTAETLGRQTDIRTHRQTYIQTHIHRQIDRQTDRSCGRFSANHHRLSCGLLIVHAYRRCI